ncbi:glycine cleavage system protein GcvH [bacterium]|nr:glycine cleavage system protein GcvH [bacterium]
MADKIRYSDEHLWVRVDGESARIGITDFLQDKLGDIVSVNLPEAGEEIERGEPLGEIETATELRELIAPVTGIVLATNPDVEDQPSLVNEDAQGDGWLLEIELREEDELDELIDFDDYEGLVAGEREEDSDSDEE